MTMSIGEDRVRVKFNPSAEGTVDAIKLTPNVNYIRFIAQERRRFRTAPCTLAEAPRRQQHEPWGDVARRSQGTDQSGNASLQSEVRQGSGACHSDRAREARHAVGERPAMLRAAIVSAVSATIGVGIGA